MVWYGWLLLIIAVLLLIALVIVWIFKSRPIVGLSDEEIKKLIDIEIEKSNEILITEQKKNKELEQIAEDQRIRLKSIAAWFDKSNREIDEESKSEFETYISDPGELDDKLDQLLQLNIGAINKEG